MLLDVLPLIPWQLALGATGHVFKLARLARLPRTYSRLQPTVVYARQHKHVRLSSQYEAFNACGAGFAFSLSTHLCACISWQVLIARWEHIGSAERAAETRYVPA
eukprot:3518931-Prymnesium_polylepis.2